MNPAILALTHLALPPEILSVSSIFYLEGEINPHIRFMLSQSALYNGEKLEWKESVVLQSGRASMFGPHVGNTSKSYSLVGTENGPLLVIWKSDEAPGAEEEHALQPFYERAGMVLKALQLLYQAEKVA